MDPNSIKLETMNRMFEYEKIARMIDDLDRDQLRNLAKAYFKLYLKQQEVIRNFAISGLA